MAKSLGLEFAQHVAAGFSVMWVRSHEHDAAVAEMLKASEKSGFALSHWNFATGVRALVRQKNPPTTVVKSAPGAAPCDQDLKASPLDLIRTLSEQVKPASADWNSEVLILENLGHLFADASGRVTNLALLQAIKNFSYVADKSCKHLVILSLDGYKIPTDLERTAVTLDHPLPSLETIRDILHHGISASVKPPAKDTEAEASLLNACKGLTGREVENALSLSITTKAGFHPGVVWSFKSQALRKGGLQLLQGPESFDDIGGMASLKQFSMRLLRGAAAHGLPPKGIMLVGVPGAGKSYFCKALGNAVGWPTVVFDVGAMFGSLVGQTEEAVRRALAVVDAMAPCVLMIDEVEKALSGTSGGANDSGVSARLLGTLLTWMQERTSNVMVVCTSNDVSRLPPEFTRAGRFDATVFMDLPSEAEKSAIWDIHLKKYGLEKIGLPNDKTWTGAEIEGCCRLAKTLGVPLAEAALNVVPIVKSSGDKLESLRRWASDKCLSAAEPGVYQYRSPETVGQTAETVSAPRKRQVKLATAE